MHLDANDVARYVDGRIGEAERQDVEAHLAECPECSERVAAAHGSLEELREQEPPALDPEVRRKAEALGAEGNGERDERHSAVRPAAIAGVLVLLLGLAGVLYWHLQGPGSTRLRSPTEGEVLTARAPADGARVSEPPVLAWEEVSGAFAYRVTLYAPDGTVLWEKDTTTTRVPLPADVSLTEGRRYLWRAAALHSEGRELRSNLRTFTYAP